MHIRSFALLGLMACSSPDSEFKALKPDIAVAPDAIDFGDVVKLYEVSFEVQVLNAGRAPLAVDDITREDEVNGEGESGASACRLLISMVWCFIIRLSSAISSFRRSTRSSME